MYSCISFLSCTHSSPLIFCSSIYTLPSSRTPTAHPSFSSPSTSCHHPAPHPPSDVLPATPGSYFICCTTHIWRNTNTSCLTSCGMWVNTTGHNNEIVSCCYFFVTFYIILKLHLAFCIFLGDFLALCLKTDMIVYHSNFSGKGLPVTLTLLCYSVILCIPARLFLSDTNRKSFKRNKPIGRKCCQLKALKILLMYYLSHY